MKLNDRLPPVISPTVSKTDSSPSKKPDASSKTPTPTVETAFGQAKLRELIKRYQG